MINSPDFSNKISKTKVRAAGFLVALISLFLDQLSKYYVAGPLALPERLQIRILPIFDLKWVLNYGISMGFLTADSNMGRWILVALTVTIACIVTMGILRERKITVALALGLVLGGAIGNISDRIRSGAVVDFLDLHFGNWHPFLVFNVADAAISCGVVWLILQSLCAPKDKNNKTF
ncbi:MAG: signal peptidase II [Zymomonas mobilis subsp. pomaceae]|uniref:Lipoprotein signal peptidase n=1 Tax=Zymomonas mobilis subsp. pomaceae (strain ATCC 29192 / DSM 22645 / JCM 10191 / CCUG 17912 / NBRC 13757 / NCIMB 11200 / NRRL B-4491 / Barker I) TaxID=579138 RepID=F8ESJ1_ZYMMT|nr:signal peptidase II [Zymomonas mobilis]AEI37766.1 lipoprotein signal peptidase [Zymomonas mobilis subsp. pomaceae ATCC 29192]MDX5949133.1 signal peptidase II [Zymomonas mobilis subsp. pomaceae]GEB88940.1 lipoprotein signal peptidase [Zymomonas mobilis subsp. pomaceae]